MGPEKPEQFTPPPDDFDSENAWRSFAAELMGKDATPEGIEAAAKEGREFGTDITRREFRHTIFAAGDAIEHAPDDFPDRKALLDLLLAAAKLADPLLARNRAYQLKAVLRDLTRATEALGTEAESIADPFDSP